MESWRFEKLLARAVARLDLADQPRFVNQHRYFARKIDECLERAGLTFVSLEGQSYDTGSAVSALNIADFDPDEELMVDQMVEPIIMGVNGLVRPGTVILKRPK